MIWKVFFFFFCYFGLTYLDAWISLKLILSLFLVISFLNDLESQHNWKFASFNLFYIFNFFLFKNNIFSHFPLEAIEAWVFYDTFKKPAN